MISTIIPVKDDLNLHKTIDCYLASYTDPNNDELVVVFNGSSNDYIRNTLNLYKNHRNIKFYSIKVSNIAIARNLGILKSKNDLICFIDSDCTFGSKYFDNFKKRYNPSSVLVIRGRNVFKGKSNFFNINYAKLRNDWYSMPLNIYFPSILISKKVFIKRGFFDPFFSGCEDAEWSRRINLKSCYVKTTKNAVLIHKEDPVIKTLVTFLNYGKARGFLLKKETVLYNKKTIPTFVEHLRKIPRYKLSRGFSFQFVLLLYNIISFLGVIRGYWHYRKNNSHSFYTQRVTNLKHTQNIKFKLLN